LTSSSSGLPAARPSLTLKVMTVHFTPEQEARLAQIAAQAGTVPERLVTNVVARYLDEEARFLAAVENGIAAAERGEFTEEEEMDERFVSEHGSTAGLGGNGSTPKVPILHLGPMAPFHRRDTYDDVG